jgi:hypothetical protein
MASHCVSCTAALMLALVGCSAGDLTLPDSGRSGQDQAAALRAVSGDGQQAEAGTVLDKPLTVEVLDESSRPLPDVRVRFTFLGEFSGAALDPTSVLTDGEGRAAAIVRLGTVPGEQVIIAEVADTQLAQLRTRSARPPWSPGATTAGRRMGRGAAAAVMVTTMTTGSWPVLWG